MPGLRLDRCRNQRNRAGNELVFDIGVGNKSHHCRSEMTLIARGTLRESATFGGVESRIGHDDCRCDVYCYEDVGGGFTTHVAQTRPVLSNIPPEETRGSVAFFDRRKLVRKMLDEAEYKEIGLPYDGATFNDPDQRSAADRLIMLKAAGYNVPQSAIDLLLEEAVANGV